MGSDVTPMLQPLVDQYLAFTNRVLTDAARSGYRGKIFVWVEFDMTTPAMPAADMCWSTEKPTDAPADRYYEYEIDDANAAALIAADARRGGVADA